MGAQTCVVFDIDDTLYLERDYVRSGFRAAGAWFEDQVGIDGFFERAWSAFESGARGTIFNGALRDLGVGDSPTLIAGLVDVYRNHEPKIELLQDARACLDRLSKWVRLGVVTDGPAVSQRTKARTLGLERWFQEVVFTVELGPNLSKPNPRAFELIQRRTSCAGLSCTYVADNPAKDFSGPKQLGWRTVRVRRPGALHYEVDSAADVDIEVDDLSSLPELMDSRGATTEGNEALC